MHPESILLRLIRYEQCGGNHGEVPEGFLQWYLPIVRLWDNHPTMALQCFVRKQKKPLLWEGQWAAVSSFSRWTWIWGHLRESDGGQGIILPLIAEALSLPYRQRVVLLSSFAGWFPQQGQVPEWLWERWESQIKADGHSLPVTEQVVVWEALCRLAETGLPESKGASPWEVRLHIRIREALSSPEVAPEVLNVLAGWQPEDVHRRKELIRHWGNKLHHGNEEVRQIVWKALFRLDPSGENLTPWLADFFAREESPEVQQIVAQWCPDSPHIRQYLQKQWMQQWKQRQWPAWRNRLSRDKQRAGAKKLESIWCALVKLDGGKGTIIPTMLNQLKSAEGIQLVDVLSAWKPGDMFIPESLWQAWGSLSEVPEENIRVAAWRVLLQFDRGQGRILSWLLRQLPKEIRSNSYRVIDVMSRWEPAGGNPPDELCSIWCEQVVNHSTPVMQSMGWKALCHLFSRSFPGQSNARWMDAWICQHLSQVHIPAVLEEMGQWPPPGHPISGELWEAWKEKTSIQAPLTRKTVWGVLRRLVNLPDGQLSGDNRYLPRVSRFRQMLELIVEQLTNEQDPLVICEMARWKPEHDMGTEQWEQWGEVWSAHLTHPNWQVRKTAIEHLQRVWEHFQGQSRVGQTAVLNALKCEENPEIFFQLLSLLRSNQCPDFTWDSWLLLGALPTRNMEIQTMAVLARQEWTITWLRRQLSALPEPWSEDTMVALRYGLRVLQRSSNPLLRHPLGAYHWGPVQKGLTLWLKLIRSGPPDRTAMPSAGNAPPTDWEPPESLYLEPWLELETWLCHGPQHTSAWPPAGCPKTVSH